MTLYYIKLFINASEGEVEKDINIYEVMKENEMTYRIKAYMLPEKPFLLKKEGLMLNRIFVEYSNYTYAPTYTSFETILEFDNEAEMEEFIKIKISDMKKELKKGYETFISKYLRSIELLSE